MVVAKKASISFMFDSIPREFGVDSKWFTYIVRAKVESSDAHLQASIGFKLIVESKNNRMERENNLSLMLRRSIMTEHATMMMAAPRRR